MIRKTSLLLTLLAGLTPILASAGTLINDPFDTTNIAFEPSGVETLTEGNTFSTTPLTGCPVDYAIPVAAGDTSVDVLSSANFFGPAVNFFGGATASSALETKLSTVVGETYTVNFTLKAVGPYAGHTIVGSTAGATSGAVGPGNHEFSFIATGAATTLTFTGVNCPTAPGCNANSDIALDSLTVTTPDDVTDCSIPEPVIDTDADGIADTEDACPTTEAGALVDATGCSIAEYCGCDDFRNHGGYVSCTDRTAEAFLQGGLISELEKDSIVSTAAQSSCGKPVKKNKHSHKDKHSDKSKKDKKKHKKKGKHSDKKSDKKSDKSKKKRSYKGKH
jgi:hypothetical protein